MVHTTTRPIPGGGLVGSRVPVSAQNEWDAEILDRISSVVHKLFLDNWTSQGHMSGPRITDRGEGDGKGVPLEGWGV